MMKLQEIQKWWGMKEEWGERQGTGEAEIACVRVLDEFGASAARFRPGGDIKVEVDFVVIKEIQEPHFGVAIFRTDGVYCHGPNTSFDGLKIESLKVGGGKFSIEYKNLPLAPGRYFLSVAIWDKKELYPYSYHPAFYNIEILGENKSGQLLILPTQWECPDAVGGGDSTEGLADLVNLACLEDKFSKRIEAGGDGAQISQVVLLNDGREERDSFRTGGELAIKTVLSDDFDWAGNYIWVGIYRRDGIYCQGSIKRLSKNEQIVKVIYPNLSLLMGEYLVSIGIWDDRFSLPLVCHHGVYPFEVLCDKKDHGTVYIDHNWAWSLP